jgi:MoaA/NifB/PqqE/SkfB family radical SAM enzyme
MREAGFIGGEITKYFKPAGLDSLVHFVTYQCNARCEHCFFSKELNKKNELSKDEIFRVINGLGLLKGVLISGGEPFLRSDLDQIVIEYVRKCRADVVSIPTNGFNTDQILASCDNILGNCRNLNLTLAVSLDGLFEMHDKERNFPGGFIRTVETARRLNNLKAKHPRLRLQIVTVIMPKNIDLLQKISEFVREKINPDYHWFEPIRLSGSRDFSSRISRDELKLFLKANIAYYFKKVKGTSPNIYSSRLLNNAIVNFSLNNLEIALDNFFDGRKWPVKCVAGRKIAVLYPDGSIAACELRLPVANVRDFGYNLTKLLKQPAFKMEARDISRGDCSCFHGCFIPPSVRFSPLHMGRLALKTIFTK